MSGYENAPEPAPDADEVLTSAQAFARARRALEEAETELYDLAKEVGEDGPVDQRIALLDSLTRVGRGWAELGAALRRAER